MASSVDPGLVDGMKGKRVFSVLVLLTSLTACRGEDGESGAAASPDVPAPESHAEGEDPQARIAALEAELAALREENLRLRELLAAQSGDAVEPTSDPSVGDRVDEAVDATGHGLRVAGEKTEEGLEKAADATGRFLQRMGRKLERTADDEGEQ